MLREHDNKQIGMEFVCIEELVPKDHLLRKIDRVVDFDFIRDKVKDLYCADNGRPAVDPVVLFKMLFLGYLFGVRSERQLVREIQVNVAYRWFIGYGLSDKIPDASSARTEVGVLLKAWFTRRSSMRSSYRRWVRNGSMAGYSTPTLPM